MRLQEIVYKIISQLWKEEKKESSRSSLSFPCLPARLLIFMHRSDTSLLEIIKRGEFGSLTNEDAIRHFNSQFGSELKRLQRATSTIEIGDAAPKGSLGRQGLTPSQFLFGEDFPEVNRTLTGLLAMKWLIANDYDSFSAYQPAAVRLKPDSFKSFRNLAMETVSDTNQLLALIVSFVVADIGKDPSLAEEVKAKGGKLAADENHDEIVYIAATLDLLAPLRLLPPDLKGDVIVGLNVGSKLNIPQLSQAENVPGSLQSALSLRNHERAFAIKYLESVFDVAGAMGHVDSRGAVRLTEPVYESFDIGRKALLDIIAGRMSLRAGYDQILKHQSRILEGEGFKALSTEDPVNRALLRLLAMGRVAGDEDAKTFEKAFKSLPEPIRQSLVNGLNVDGYEDGEAVILYYMPALFAEALRNPKDATQEMRIQILMSLMRFMARAYGGSKPQAGRRGSIVERDVSLAKETVRSDAFKADPAILDELPVHFE